MSTKFRILKLMGWSLKNFCYYKGLYKEKKFSLREFIEEFDFLLVQGDFGGFGVFLHMFGVKRFRDGYDIFMIDEPRNSNLLDGSVMSLGHLLQPFS